MRRAAAAGPTQTRTIALIDLLDLSPSPTPVRLPAAIDSSAIDIDPVLQVASARVQRSMSIENDDDGRTESDEICSAEAHSDKFDPAIYLDSFYKTASEDPAMQIVLFFLPGLLYRLPPTLRTVLDLGAGPTVYLPITLRERALQIFTSDYAKVNRDVLQSWIEDRSAFDWSNVCTWISNIEASTEEPAEMQQKAREKVNAVLEVNVHETPVVRSVHWQRDGCEIPEKFQLVSTVFCLEYSCETLEGYRRAVRGACSLIEDDGYLLQGGVLEATTYNFGGKVFKCHYLKRCHIEESLKYQSLANMFNEHQYNNCKSIVNRGPAANLSSSAVLLPFFGVSVSTSGIAGALPSSSLPILTA